MADEKKIPVKLYADCIVDGERRKAGEIVAVPEPIAVHFGSDPNKPSKDTEKLHAVAAAAKEAAWSEEDEIVADAPAVTTPAATEPAA